MADLPDPVRTSQQMASRFFGRGRSAVRRAWSGAAWAALLTPLGVWLRFGEVGPLGWGLTVFLTMYCLLAGLGTALLDRPDWHSPMKLRGDLWDRIGSLWLVACVFGPLLGWILTETLLPAWSHAWRALWSLHLALAMGLPLLTLLPLLRYLRGPALRVGLPLLLAITLLPLLSGLSSLKDLQRGEASTVRRLTPAQLQTCQTGARLNRDCQEDVSGSAYELTYLHASGRLLTVQEVEP